MVKQPLTDICIDLSRHCVSHIPKIRGHLILDTEASFAQITRLGHCLPYLSATLTCLAIYRIAALSHVPKGLGASHMHHRFNGGGVCSCSQYVARCPRLHRSTLHQKLKVTGAYIPRACASAYCKTGITGSRVHACGAGAVWDRPEMPGGVLHHLRRMCKTAICPAQSSRCPSGARPTQCTPSSSLGRTRREFASPIISKVSFPIQALVQPLF